MKKVLALILTLMTALALFGCASGGGAANSAEPTNSPGSAPEAQAVSSEAAEKVLRVAMTTGMG
ncbi:MAG: YgdI/YgdR family lipoprotein, partial [Peptococcaceae bacterium]|nr:YgdI/YgdR family lipoprotein [Peptococcaceae bacterium]